jgi:hypothetical protein
MEIKSHEKSKRHEIIEVFKILWENLAGSLARRIKFSVPEIRV